MIRKKSLALKVGEVKKLESDEDMESDKKNKSFALKDGEFKELESDGDMNVLVCIFKKYIRHKKQTQNFHHKNEERSSFMSICF